ncbi:MAG: hypothetical protein RL521_1114, partial [Bacteroidota bacterium]
MNFKNTLVLSFCALFTLAISAQETDINLLLGKVDYSKNKKFGVLPQEMTTKENAFLQTVVIDSLKKMFTAAKKEGIHFKVISAS